MVVGSVYWPGSIDHLWIGLNLTRNSLSFCNAYWPDSEEFYFLFNWANLRYDNMFKEIQ